MKTPQKNIFQSPCNVSCDVVYGSSIKLLFQRTNDCQRKYQEKTIKEIIVYGYKNMYNAWAWWGRWTVCTKTCGGGIRSRYRYCDNPTQLKCRIPNTVIFQTLYRGMEFKIVQRRPKYSVGDTWNTNHGYSNDEQSANTEC